MDAETRSPKPLESGEIPGPGARLADRYELIDVVGRGGRGVVYRAEDPVLGREVAVKLVPDADEDPGGRARFHREALVVARLDHPHIVPVFDFGEHMGHLFFVMPLLSGGSLRRRLIDGNLSLGEALQVGAQVASALEYSHARGVVHRDVKPENILFAGDASVLRVRVTDFGLAHERGSSRLTKTNHLPGTLAYLSPEQVSSGWIDGRADLYALGVVLYECLCGRPPFEGAPFSVLYRVAHEPVETLSARGVEVDPELEELVMRCLAKERDQRPADGREVSEILTALHERLEPGERERTLEPGTQTAISSLEGIPLIGRAAEMETLRAHLDASVRGECHLVFVTGHAGTGKSRILQEMATHCVMRGVRVLRGHFSADDRTFPYQGLCELVQDYFRIRHVRPADSSSTTVARTPRDGTRQVRSLPELQDLAPGLLRLFPQLTEIPALREVVEEGRMPQREKGQDDKTQVFELLARTFARLGSGRPLVLLLENLHLGGASVEALGYLVPRLASTPTLIVATYRPAEAEPRRALRDLERQFTDDPRFDRIAVENLGRGAFAELLSHLVGSDAVAAPVVDRLHASTEGNPLFLHELVASLRESGELTRAPSGLWRLNAEVGALTHGLPATLRQAAEGRLARLEAADRELLAAASVLGRSFDVEDLHALAADDDSQDEPTPGDPTPDEAMDRRVQRLIEVQLLEDDAASRGDRLAFTSGVLRDVLYRDLSRRRRRSLHRRCARHLERRFRGRLARVLPRLVHHASRAGEAADTVRYALQSARRSLAAHSLDDALQATRTGLEWVDDPAVPASKRSEAELLHVSARALQRLGDLDGALRRGESACRRYGELEDFERAAKVALFVAETAWRGRRVEEGRIWVDRGADLARASRGDGRPESGPGIQTLRRLLTLGATLANLRGEPARARAYLEEADGLDGDDIRQMGAVTVPRGGTLRVAMTHPVSRLVPGKLETDEEAEVALNVFETLLVSEDEGGLRPRLCDEWRSSSDGRSFWLHIDRRARFSDGEAVRAVDLKRSFERSARAGSESLAPGFFTVIEGMSEMLAGEAEDARGLQVIDESRLEIRLVESLPLFPILLTDCRTVIARRNDEDETWIGTGPFVVAEEGRGRVLLERNPEYWRDEGARVARLDFRTGFASSQIAAALRAGEIDLGRDLRPRDLETLLRDPKWRSGLVETTRKNIYFVLFNPRGPVSSHLSVRKALMGVVWRRDVVWRTLGRFAQPAQGMIPPGVLGHDAGRRDGRLSRARARILLEEAEISFPVRLRAAVHPVLQDRYASLLAALFTDWASLGVEVEVVTGAMGAFLDAYRQNESVDLLLGRWNADYDDPDNFTFNPFHSRFGIFRQWTAAEGSDEADDLLQRARREGDPAVRVALYRRFEELLERRGLVLPLFHDIDYRLASQRVRNLSLATTYPYVGYAELGVTGPDRDSPGVSERFAAAGSLDVPICGPVGSLDPAAATTVEILEVVSNVFETLCRLDRSARIIPWLATSLEPQAGGRRYRVRLRSDLRFHDGRPCTTRDVRYSFERLLRSPRRESHFVLLPVRGARALRDGECEHLAGLEIVSTHELTLELDEPLAFFPALLAHPLAAIVPEGATSFDGRWRDGTVGTGPFRVIRFEPDEHAEMEANPYYWRRGLPRAGSLAFRLDLQPPRVARDFAAGRLDLAGDLLPEDLERLRRGPIDDSTAERRAAKRPGFLEMPRLSTYFLCLDHRRGPFADVEIRRAFAHALDLGTLIAATLGSRVSRAHGLLPPGLLGHDPRRRAPERDLAAAERIRGLELQVRVHPHYLGPLEPFWIRWCEEMERLGVRLELAGETFDRNVEDRGAVDSADLVGMRWLADYPDSDSFALALEFCSQWKMIDAEAVPELGRLAVQARHESDPALRHALYRELEDVLARECLLIPLFHDQAYRLIQPRVRGLRLGLGFPEVAYEELWIEP